jgi:GNAT superfamily N-acetyltransferase
MQTRVIRIKKLGLVTIRPLRNGDPNPVHALFERLATVDDRSYSIVAYVERDPDPAGLAQLIRDHDCWTHAEIVLALADCYQGKQIGAALVEYLAADARAAGITHLTVTMQPANSAAQTVVRRRAKIAKQPTLAPRGASPQSQVS